MRRRLAIALCALVVALTGAATTVPASAAPGDPPTVSHSVVCQAGLMTITVVVENVDLASFDYVNFSNGRNSGASRVLTDPQTFTQSGPAMRPIRMWVSHEGATVYDTGEIYLAEDGTCGVPTPPLGEGITWDLASSCIASGARFTLDIDAQQVVKRTWTQGEVSLSASQLYSGPAQHLFDVPVGDEFRLELADAWNRSLLSTAPVVATSEGACTAAPQPQLAPAVDVGCVDGKPWAAVGVHNIGNATIDGDISWTVDGQDPATDPDEDHFDLIVPGEIRWYDLGEVPPGVVVDVGAGIDAYGFEWVDDTTPTDCTEESPPAPGGPTGSSDVPVPTAGPGAAPAPTAPATAVAGASEARTSLPRTGLGLAAAGGFAVVLLAGGQALLALSRRHHAS